MTTRKPDDHTETDDLRIDAAWRAASREEPPPALDAAIRAAARREVGAGPQRAGKPVPEATSPERWWWPLAAAATIGAIALGLLQIVGTNGDGGPGGGPAVVSDMPEGPRATGSPRPDAALPREDAAAKPAPKPAAEPAVTPPRARESRPQPPLAAPVEATEATPPAGAAKVVAPALAPTPPAATPARLSGAVEPSAGEGAGPRGPAAADAQRGEAQAPVMARDAASPAARPAAAPAPAPRGEARSPIPLPVAEWIALIRRLRDEGKTDEAAKELAVFRAAHPDHETLLPPDLRDWKPAAR
jgi:hypothetical protein